MKNIKKTIEENREKTNLANGMALSEIDVDGHEKTRKLIEKHTKFHEQKLIKAFREEVRKCQPYNNGDIHGVLNNLERLEEGLEQVIEEYE